MENSNILVALFLTIVITSSIVLFNGMDTPESTEFANFDQQIANVSSAVIDQLTSVATQNAIDGKTRNTEQIYYTLATGLDAGEYGTMMGADYLTPGSSGKKFQRINPNYAKNSTKDNKGLGITLPKIRETNEAWYITAEGKIFNATGFVFNGRTYFTADCYVERELPAKSGPQEDLAAKIADALIARESVVNY